MVLLKNREEFWSRAEAQNLRWSELPSLVVFIGLACALYGSVLAGWRSPRLALYVAAKLPLLFLGTAAFVAVFNWMVAALLGSGLSFKSTVFAVFAAMAIGSWILLALVPVAFFFLSTASPMPAPRRTAVRAQLDSHDPRRPSPARGCSAISRCTRACVGSCGRVARSPACSAPGWRPSPWWAANCPGFCGPSSAARSIPSSFSGPTPSNGISTSSYSPKCSRFC
jgi:hypothetical protein